MTQRPDTTRSRVIFLAVWISLCAPPALAQGLDALAEELLIRSGLDKQMESFPELVMAGMRQARQQSRQPVDADFEALEVATAKAFDPAALKSAVTKHIKLGLSATDINAALAWLNSPTGRKITRMEEEASTSEAFAEMQAWAGTLAQHPQSEGRIGQARRLDAAAKITEFGMTLMLDTQLAMVAAVTATRSPAEQRGAFDAVRAAFEKSRNQVKEMVAQQTMISLLYSYRELPDPELDQYIKFAESSAGQKYQAVVSDGMDAAIIDASRKAGTAIADELSRQKDGARRL